jgi:hypothetical protein
MVPDKIETNTGDGFQNESISLQQISDLLIFASFSETYSMRQLSFFYSDFPDSQCM